MAEAFAADWLALREGADHRARAAGLLRRLQAQLPATGPLNVLDLGAGRGSNLRYLAPRLRGPQHWRLLDHDHRLLAGVAAPPRAADGSAVTFAGEIADLNRALPAALDDAQLVTAAALLDLVSAAWLQRLADGCAARGVPALLALSYDGCIQWPDTDPDDERLRTAVNAHQQGDKGFGPALGPAAWETAAAAFRASGCEVVVADSPWRLGPGDAPLIHALIDGWVAAACAQAPAAADRFRAWAGRRKATDSVTVGHRDLLALPASAVP